MERTIEESLMTKGRDFIFGKDIFNPNKELTWNPDKCQTNGNGAIWGTSGSGKSRLIRKMIEYLAKQSKTIHVIDPHGDLGVASADIPPENCMEFTARNSTYGINPFEYERDEANGGPAVQAQEILHMFQKAFPKIVWGPKQISLLLALIRDTYKSKGIFEEDIDTWGLSKDKIEFAKSLPTLNDMHELLNYIRESASTGFGIEFAKIVKRNGVFLSESKEKIDKQEENLRELKSRRPKELQGYLFEKNVINKEADFTDEEKQKKLEKLAKTEKEIALYLGSNPNAEKLEGQIAELEAQIKDIRSKVYKKKEKLQEYFNDFIEYTYLGASKPSYLSSIEEGKYDFLDISFYGTREALKILETLNIYIALLTESNIFNSQPPKILGGTINRYVLKGLPEQTKIFFCDALVSKINRSLKLRGEYHKLDINSGSAYSFNKRFPHAKFDTAIVIDEAQSLFPHNKQERESTAYSINKGVSEIRKFGGLYLFSTQRPQNYPGIVLSNSSLKIGLKTDQSDENATQSLLGVEKGTFAQIRRFGTACITDTKGDFKIVLLPWANLDGLK